MQNNAELKESRDYLNNAIQQMKQEQKVILYFYSKDGTAGCTKQACGFAERYSQFTEKGAVVLGISKDSVASHKKFVEKFASKTDFTSSLYVVAVIAKGCSRSWVWSGCICF